MSTTTRANFPAGGECPAASKLRDSEGGNRNLFTKSKRAQVKFSRQLCARGRRKCLLVFLCCLFLFCWCFYFCWRADVPERLHRHCEKFGKQLPTRDILFKCLLSCFVLSVRNVLAFIAFNSR